MKKRIKYVIVNKRENYWVKVVDATFPTRERAQSMIGLMRRVNLRKSLLQTVGDPDTLRIAPVECWSNGDPKKVIFKEEELV